MSLVRDEIRALRVLRESEHALAKAREKRASDGQAARRVKEAIGKVDGVRKRREKEGAAMSGRVEKWWRNGRKGRAPAMGAECFEVAPAFGVGVPASSLRTLDAVRKAYAACREKGKIKEGRVAAPVLPLLGVEEMSTLQNLPAADHAALSLLARWVVHALPSEPTLRRAADEFGVGFAVPPLLALRASDLPAEYRRRR